MIHAYDEMYLEKARTALGRMLDFAVYDAGYDISVFFDLFISSGMARRFERGDVSVVVGRSGVELAYDIMYSVNGLDILIEPQYTYNRSPEYWLGWALAYYQWKSGLKFSDIVRSIPIKTILGLYDIYHEMDIRQFEDKMNELYRLANSDTKLKQLRKKAGLSQSKLAEASHIPVRTIQQYEQRQKNINKASVEYLVNLSRTLHCSIEDLLEYEETTS
ncbi:MAG: helix-turn-helix transcriptional regulator [Lachnospiraceae bacterium]|nr:helix-turn-helix transcriptional regulator [Lachnospiraceae bacterium]